MRPCASSGAKVDSNSSSSLCEAAVGQVAGGDHLIDSRLQEGGAEAGGVGVGLVAAPDVKV